jgi:psiF repeat
MKMPGYLFGMLLLATMLAAAPAGALTNEEKLATCNFGADHQHLEGAARKAFIEKCMADEDRGGPRTAPPRR